MVERVNAPAFAMMRWSQVAKASYYGGDSVEFDDAQGIVAQAEVFVAAMHAGFMPLPPII